MEASFKKYFLPFVLFVLPIVLGVILDQYLNLAWIVLISIVVSIFLVSLYLFFHQKFKHLDENINIIGSRIENIREALGTSEDGEKLSWSSFWSKVQQLAARIEGSDFDPDIVISVGRSGAVIGGMIASILGTKKHIGLDRIVVITQKSNFPDERSVEIDKTVTLNADALQGKKILCVMSECSTGNTLHTIYEFFRKFPDVELRTAVIFTKFNVTCSPDFFVDLTENWPKLPFRIEGKWKNYYPRTTRKPSTLMP